MYLEKELVCDSGGPGKFRGGCGQLSIIKPISFGQRGVVASMTFGIRGGRYEDTIPGICGGGDGGATKVIINEKRERTGKQFTIKPEDILTLEAPGGGYGDSFSRNPELVNQDLKNGLVSIEKARSIYGVVVDDGSLEVDIGNTRALRTQRKRTI